MLLFYTHLQNLAFNTTAVVINFPRIPYGDPRNLVGFFFLKYVFEPEKTLKGPSQPVCIAAVCYCYYPGDLMSFTVQMT